MLLIEAAATLFGLACVLLTIRQNILCWPTGLVQVMLFIIIFYQVRLYSDLILHVLYVFLQIYGWHHWLHGGRDRDDLPVTALAPSALGRWILIGAAGTLLWGHLMDRFTHAALPYPDAFTTVSSLIAQWLMARKRLDSWYFWIAVDIAALGIYFYKGLYLTTGLYALFLGLAVAGLMVWRRRLQPFKPVLPSLAVSRSAGP